MLCCAAIGSLRHVLYNETLHQPNLFSLECRRLRAVFIMAFKVFKGVINLCPPDLFILPPRSGFRKYTDRKIQGPSHLTRRSGEFSVRLLIYRTTFSAFTVICTNSSVAFFLKFLRNICSPLLNRLCKIPFSTNSPWHRVYMVVFAGLGPTFTMNKSK